MITREEFARRLFVRHTISTDVGAQVYDLITSSLAQATLSTVALPQLARAIRAVAPQYFSSGYGLDRCYAIADAILAMHRAGDFAPDPPLHEHLAALETAGRAAIVQHLADEHDAPGASYAWALSLHRAAHSEVAARRLATHLGVPYPEPELDPDPGSTLLDRVVDIEHRVRSQRSPEDSDCADVLSLVAEIASALVALAREVQR